MHFSSKKKKKKTLKPKTTLLYPVIPHCFDCLFVCLLVFCQCRPSVLGIAHRKQMFTRLPNLLLKSTLGLWGYAPYETGNIFLYECKFSL